MGIDEENIGEAIEQKLEALQARADPRVFDQAVELLQLVTELYSAGLARVMELADQHAPDLVARIIEDDLLASLLLASGLHPEDVHVRIARASVARSPPPPASAQRSTSALHSPFALSPAYHGSPPCSLINACQAAIRPGRANAPDITIVAFHGINPSDDSRVLATVVTRV